MVFASHALRLRRRYMGFFEAQILSWKSKLGMVRAVLEAWMEVQRQWCSLEVMRAPRPDGS